MLAIPIFRSRVAPVFNWCSKLLLFPKEAQERSSCEELVLPEGADSFERLRILHRKGVTTLVCGALSPELLRYAEGLELEVLCGVAGGISEVLEAYRAHRLDQPQFRLPGCCCERRGCGTERSSTMPGKSGKGFGQGQGKRRGNAAGGAGGMGGRSSGPGGECVCPKCGTVSPHTQGTPCTQMLCPGCGQQMVRR